MSISDRLDEIQVRADKALTGPWEVNPFAHSVRKAGTSKAVCQLSVLGNAAFIAHARTDVPDLLAAVRAVLAIDTGDNRNVYGLDFEAGMCKALAIVHQTIAAALGEEP